MQLRRRQLVAGIDGTDGYVTLYGKNGGRNVRVGRRTWEALQFLAAAKAADDRIIAISDERIQQILTAARITKDDLAVLASPCSTGSHAVQRGAPAATIRDTLGARLVEHDGFVSQFSADRRFESIFEIPKGRPG